MDGQGHVTPDGAGFRCVTRRDSHTGRETHPGEARARIQFRDPPRRRWQLGLMNPRAAANLQRTGGKPFDTRNGRGPLRPSLHVRHHRPHKGRRRGDFHRDDKIRSSHSFESRAIAQLSSATASAIYPIETIIAVGDRAMGLQYHQVCGTTATVNRPTNLHELMRIFARLILGQRHKSRPGLARHRGVFVFWRLPLGDWAYIEARTETTCACAPNDPTPTRMTLFLRSPLGLAP